MNASDVPFFYEWHAPSEMEAEVALLGKRLGQRTMAREGVVYREAFVASRFAAHSLADAVRLLRPRQQPTPDFGILVSGAELWYETTEADRPGRRRTQEYSTRLPSERPQPVPDEHWVEPEIYLAVIRERAASKAAKIYDKCDGLIIWSNAFPIAEEHRLDRTWWRNAAEPARNSFSEVWVYFSGQFNRIS